MEAAVGKLRQPALKQQGLKRQARVKIPHAEFYYLISWASVSPSLTRTWSHVPRRGIVGDGESDPSQSASRGGV